MLRWTGFLFESHECRMLPSSEKLEWKVASQSWTTKHQHAYSIVGCPGVRTCILCNIRLSAGSARAHLGISHLETLSFSPTTHNGT